MADNDNDDAFTLAWQTTMMTTPPAQHGRQRQRLHPSMADNDNDNAFTPAWRRRQRWQHNTHGQCHGEDDDDDTTCDDDDDDGTIPPPLHLHPLTSTTTAHTQ